MKFTLFRYQHIHLLKKIISPILYVAFLILTLIITIVIVGIIELDGTVHPEILIFIAFIVIIVIGTLLFWPANELMTELEKLLNPGILDHFRQANLCYLVALCALTFLLRYGYYNGLVESYLLLILAISVWAIIINSIFLYKRRKANIT